MTPRHVRALRGASAAVVATLVAATAHTLSGGGAPPPLLLVAVALLAMPVTTALVGRRRALWRTFATVLASQAMFHVAFAVAGTAGSSPMPATHAHHGMAVPLGDVVVAAAPDPLMLPGHAVAAVVTVIALHRGERMLRALGRGILRLFRPVLVVVPPQRPRRLAAHIAVRCGEIRAVFSDVSRRGPPVVVAAL